MVQLKEQRDLYASRYFDLEKKREAESPGWLVSLRREAIARWERLGFPGRRDEEWKYTNLLPISRTAFEPATDGKRPEPAVSSRFTLGRKTSPDASRIHRLVFVDGRFAAELSSLEDLPRGIEAGSLAEALHADHGPVKENLSAHLSYYQEHHPFVALNTALFEDGVCIRVEKGVRCEKLVHVLFLSSEDSRPTVCHPRLLVILEDGAELSLIEDYANLGAEPVFTNPVGELSLGSRAVLDHYRLLRESDAACHISVTGVTQGPHSGFRSHALCLGGSLTRNDVNVSLEGEECLSTLNGLAIGKGRQLIDNHTRIVHSRPHSKSWEVYKTVLEDEAVGVFNGKIYVDRIAQKTDAKQTNKSLLLSDDAEMNTKPELEIYADDVKCTHGATVGYLDAESLFYLRTRGIDLETAQNILTFAFAGEIVEQIKVEDLRLTVEGILLERLPQGPSPAGNPQGGR